MGFLTPAASTTSGHGTGRSLLASLLVGLTAVAGPLSLAGCNDYPVHSLLDSFEVRVTKKLSQRDAVKLDFLWVIDHSPSMCQEQSDLTAGFAKFISDLQSAGQVDAQMAVVTVQQLPDRDQSSLIVSKVGQFMKNPAKSFPPNCFERTLRGCLTSDDCVKPFSVTWNKPDPMSSMCAQPTREEEALPGTTADWKCRTTSSAAFLTNDNCSINSSCQYTCATDQECTNMFGPGAKCKQPGGGVIKKGEAGCIFEPDTASCPPANELPAVLKQSEPLPPKYQTEPGKTLTQLDWFKCIATVGASQSQESTFEGGLRSAWLALDPNGPNCAKDAAGKPLADCQYRQLVRDDAYLVIVVVSDDDDCSVNLDIPLSYGTKAEVDATRALVPQDIWNVCQSRGDRLASNDLLNEGRCEYLKLNAPTTKCPSDCRKLTPGTPDHTTCIEASDIAMAKARQYDPRFAATTEFVNKFRSLKADPARVIFSTITGASLLADADGAQLDHTAYYRTLFKNQAVSQSPYVCEGARGESGLGKRYMEVAQAFGDNGKIANICAGSDFSQALTSIADLILTRVVKVCLPHPPEYNEQGEPQLKVLRTTNNVKTPLLWVEGPDNATSPDTYYLKSSADCLVGKTETEGQGQTCKTTRDCSAGLACQDGLCRLYGEAIYFTTTPDQSDEVEINYAADLGL
jgi:hypothetical protein